MKWLVSIVFIASVSSTCLAQYSEQHRSCMAQAKTQSEMTICAGEEAKRTETELADVYRKVRSAAAKRQNAVEQITGAEKAWIAYRDAYIAAMYPAPNKQAEYGSMFSMEVSYLRVELARRHMEDVKNLLKHYSEQR